MYDGRGRTKSMVSSDSGSLTFRQAATTYDDSAQTASVKRDLNSVNDGIVQTTSFTDDLGHPWKTLSTDGSCNTQFQAIHLQQTPPGGGYSYQLASNPFCTNADATMGWTRTKLDPLGRVVEVAHFTGASLPAPWGSNGANSGAAQTTYNANQYTVADEAQVSRTLTTDGFNRFSSVLDGTGVTTSYTYDALNNLTSVTQGAQSRTFVYTSLGRLKTATNPENGTINYTYDDTGNLATRTDARGIATNTAYDAVDRIISKSYTDGPPATPTVTYCYDGQLYNTNTAQCAGTPAAPFIGRLTQATSSVSSTTYTNYDLAGRITASTQTTNGTPYLFSYSYNMLDGLTQEKYPSGRYIDYTYDSGGRVATVGGSFSATGPPSTPYAGFSNPITYAAHHGLFKLPLGNGITETWSYNDRLQATGVQAGSPSTSLLALNFYPCDAGLTACSNNNGNIWREVITTPQMPNPVTQEYRYDTTNRLKVAVENPAQAVDQSSACTQAVGGSWCEQFGYDISGYGNRWVNTASLNGSSVNPPADTPTSANHFDAANHITVNQATPDANGNLSQIGGSTGTRYTYDAENRLTAVTSLLTSTTIASYAYDGDGRRVQKTSGTTTTYVYDAQGELAAEYVIGTVPTPPCSTCYLTSDHLGSTRLMTDGHGNPVALHDYQPFGEEIPSGVAARSSLYGETDNPTQKFTGKERNSELANSADPYGLDYFGARYFSAAQGRFTSPDPGGVGPASRVSQ
jgi:YD repeat-containing protein